MQVNPGHGSEKHVMSQFSTILFLLLAKDQHSCKSFFTLSATNEALLSGMSVFCVFFSGVEVSGYPLPTDVKVTP